MLPPAASAPPASPSPTPDAQAAGAPAAVLAVLDPRHLARASSELSDLAASWIQLADLRKAAGARSPSALQNAASMLASGARVVFAAAVLSAQIRTHRRADPSFGAKQDCAQACLIVAGGVQHAAMLELAAHLPANIGMAWRWRPDQVDLLRMHLACTISLHPTHGIVQRCPPVLLMNPASSASPFPAVTVYFCAALAAGWPWTSAMRAFGELGPGLLSEDSRAFVTTASSSAFLAAAAAFAPLDSISLALNAGDPETFIWLLDGIIMAISSSKPLVASPPAVGMRPLMVKRRRFGRAPYASRWLPDFIRLPRDEIGVPVYPKFQATSIVVCSPRWHQLIRDVDGVSAVVLAGKLTNPRHRLPTHGSWLPNHASWEDDPEAKRMLGTEVGTYLVSSVLEYIGPAGEQGVKTPQLVEPLGAVPKPPVKKRMISDARRGNLYIDDWGVRYWTVQDLRDMLDPWDVAFAEDFRGAYHNGNLAGCTGELRWFWVQVPGTDADGNPTCHWAPRLHIGCTSKDCLGCCDRAMNGLCINGHLFRWLVEHFGHKVAGSPLNALILCLLRFLARPAPDQGELRGASRRTILGAAWVDDTVLICKGIPHARCLGIVGGCPLCSERLTVALERQEYWLWLCNELGWELALDKRQNPTQVFTYSGLIFDLVRGLLLVPELKKAKIIEDLQGMLSATMATPRRLMQVSGRLRHYSVGIMHTRVHCAHFTTVGKLHPDRSKDPDYDVPAEIPTALHETCSHLLRVIEQFHPAGADLWPEVPSSLYKAVLQQRPLGKLVIVPTYDASLHGWGTIIRSNPGSIQIEEGGSPRQASLDEVIVGTYPPGWDISDQVFREAAACCLASEASIAVAKARGFQTRGCIILARNDAASALAALRKGSPSPVLQEYAMRLSKFHAAEDINPVFLHVPGTTLVAEGVDGLSRKGFSGVPGALEVSGPACGPRLLAIIHKLAADFDWRVSIDLFASAGNTVAARFCARYDEPDAESTDAFTVPDWDRSLCPSCGHFHREVIFAFPPSPLIPVCIRKARSDQVRGIFVVPASITAPYWGRLLAASLVRTNPGYIMIPNAAKVLRNAGAYGVQKLAVFAVDFRRTASNGFRMPSSPACGSECAARGRSNPGSWADEADRARLRLALLQLTPREA